MPIQNYEIYTGKGYAGDFADTGPRTVVTGIVEAATLEMGVGVKPGTAERQVLVGHATGDVYGITVRQLNHEAANRPSDGTFTYKNKEAASVLREGFIFVKVTDHAAVAHTKLAINDTTGEFVGGTADTGETQCLNVTAIESGDADSIIKVRIDIL